MGGVRYFLSLFAQVCLGGGNILALCSLCDLTLSAASIEDVCERGIDPEAIRQTLSWKSDLLCDVVGAESGTTLEAALTKRLIELGRQPNLRRYFTGEDEIIRANGRTYVVTTQWGSRTRKAMDLLIKAFGGGTIAYSTGAPEQE